MTTPTTPSASADQPAATESLSPVRRGALTAFRVLGMLTLLAGVAQFALAGLGAFGGGFDAHRTLGSIFGIATVVLLVLMLVARPSTAAVLLALLVAVLAMVGQPLLANLGGDNDAWFGALHALNALVMMGLLGRLTSEAGRTLSS